jgi:hypothetical protein
MRQELWPEVRIVFVKTRGIMAALTRWVTACPANHVYIEAWVFGRKMVFEATTDDGVRLVPSTERLEQMVIAYRCTFDTELGLNKIAGLLGKPYDYWGVLPIAVIKLAWRWFRLHVGRRWQWSTRAIKCSELAAIFFLGSRLKIDQLNAELAAPSDVMKFCSMRPGWFDLVQGNP